MRSTDRSFVVTGNLFQQCVEYVEYFFIGQNYSTKKRFVGVDMSEMNKYIWYPSTTLGWQIKLSDKIIALKMVFYKLNITSNTSKN